MLFIEGGNMKNLWGWCLQVTGSITLCGPSSAYGIVVNHTSDKLSLLDDLVHVYFACIMFIIYCMFIRMYYMLPVVEFCLVNSVSRVVVFMGPEWVIHSARCCGVCDFTVSHGCHLNLMRPLHLFFGVLGTCL